MRTSSDRRASLEARTTARILLLHEWCKDGERLFQRQIACLVIVWHHASFLLWCNLFQACSRVLRDTLLEIGVANRFLLRCNFFRTAHTFLGTKYLEFVQGQFAVVKRVKTVYGLLVAPMNVCDVAGAIVCMYLTREAVVAMTFFHRGAFQSLATAVTELRNMVATRLLRYWSTFDSYRTETRICDTLLSEVKIIIYCIAR